MKFHLASSCFEEFINQPYFTHLKIVTNEYGLEPVACDIAPESSWRVSSAIEFRGNKIKTKICRTFKRYFKIYLFNYYFFLALCIGNS